MFKAAAVVSDIKYLLRTLDSKALAELRAMQKPDPEFEDILASVIIIGNVLHLMLYVILTGQLFCVVFYSCQNLLDS